VGRSVVAAVTVVLTAVLLHSAAAAADAGPQVVLRAGKAGGPYHGLTQELATVGGAGGLTIAVEESQSSVQNVVEAFGRTVEEAFIATPAVVRQARRGEKPFEPDPRYDEIRSLFPIPFQTLHVVTPADGPVKTLRDLAGKPVVVGPRGALAERMASAVLAILELDAEVPVIDIDLATAPTALRENQVAAFAAAGPFPLPLVSEAAAAQPIRLLPFAGPKLATLLAADDSLVAVAIPKGTYPGVAEDVPTIAVPAGAYTTTAMSEATAYALTRHFWQARAQLARESPHWKAISPTSLAILGAPLHRGAMRWYAEAGVSLPVTIQ
jgi:TRAP transporter TAXI family solute receptor